MSTGVLAPETDNFEHRDRSAGIPFLPAAILGLMGRALFGLGPAFIAADCIFPVLLFLLLFSCTRFAIDDRSFRLLVTWASILISFGVLNAFWLGEDALIAPLEITRTPQPEISFVFLVLAASLLGSALRSEATRWPRMIAAGAACGCVVYCYYYYAVALGFTLVLVILFGLAWRIRFMWMRAGLVLSLMSLLSVPYALAALKGRAQGGQTDLLGRMGAFTHAPDILPLCGAILLSGLALAKGRQLFTRYPTYLVLTLLVAGALFGMNVQVLSGYETQPWHFWKRLALPLCFYLLGIAVAYVIEKRFRSNPVRSRRACQLTLCFLVAEVAARLAYGSTVTARFHRASGDQHALFGWVRLHLPPDQVIATVDPQMILLIPALSTNFTYVPSGLRSLTSTQEIVNRYLDLACLLGLTPSDVIGLMNAPNHLHSSSLLLQVLGLGVNGSANVGRHFAAQYRSRALSCSVPSWKLDYLIVSANGPGKGALNIHFPAANLVYRNASYELLAVHPRV